MGIDRFIDWELPDVVSTYSRGLVYSYREGADWKLDNRKFVYRPNYRVGIFHQEPNLLDCLDHDIIKNHCIWNHQPNQSK